MANAPLPAAGSGWRGGGKCRGSRQKILQLNGVVPDYGSSIKPTLKAWGNPTRQFFFATFKKSQQKRRVLFEIDKTRGICGPSTAIVKAYLKRHNRVIPV
jgi:hypothetical protein